MTIAVDWDAKQQSLSVCLSVSKISNYVRLIKVKFNLGPSWELGIKYFKNWS